MLFVIDWAWEYKRLVEAANIIKVKDSITKLEKVYDILTFIHKYNYYNCE